ncbi:MAG: 2-hydroxyacid dehydrogenase [Rhodospirillaceae bacterium]|jgi:lactate dehydrogenase-like 2-hydroxyacid dehydrogenase|nr:2-hydroxyacid dehydrogenase [Rhodospirillaceae bacterium]
MKPDVLLAVPIYPATMEALDRLYAVHRLFEAADPAAFLGGVADKVRAIVTSGGAGADAALIAALPKAEIIACFGVGYDAVDLGAARARNIAVTNTPDVLTDDVADLALGLIIDAARRISRGDRFVRAGKWLQGGLELGTALRGRRLGIVGLGRIGLAAARRAEACGMFVAYHGPRPKPEAPYPYVADLVELARRSDVLVLTLPGGTGTRHLVNAEVLAALGPKGTLVNVARGSVVDETALLAALQSGALGAAALDVFADEPRVPPALLAMENVVLQPHVGSATHETRAAMGQLVLDNLAAHFAGQALPTRVA